MLLPKRNSINVLHNLSLPTHCTAYFSPHTVSLFSPVSFFTLLNFLWFLVILCLLPPSLYNFHLPLTLSIYTLSWKISLSILYIQYLKISESVSKLQFVGVYILAIVCVFNPTPPLDQPDPNSISPRVVMEPLCSELAEPTVRVSVLPHFQPTVELIDTSGEKFRFGYECEGSATVSRNLTRYVSQLYRCYNCEQQRAKRPLNDVCACTLQ